MVHILGQQRELQQKALINFVMHLFTTRPVSPNKLAIAIGTPSFTDGVLLTAELFFMDKNVKKYTQTIVHPANIGEGYNIDMMKADAYKFLECVEEAAGRILELLDADVAKMCMKGVL